jgi:hypothetical protein
MTSTYPTPVETIVDRLLDQVRKSGDLPTRNQIMKEFRVGAPKAARVLDELADRSEERTVSDPPTVPIPVLRLDPDPVPADQSPLPAQEVPPLVTVAGPPDTATPADARPRRSRLPRHWPLLLLAAPAFVSIWGGWVGLGQMAGFGQITLLPGIADGLTLDSSITLPIGVETYAAYALRVWLSGSYPPGATKWAKWSAIGSLVLGMAGQVAYHLMSAAQMDAAPWQITTLVACLPVAVLGSGAALAHLTHTSEKGA